MRRITRRLLAFLLLVVVGLLALGALPTYLGSGDPYYLTATPTNASGPAANVTGLPADRYPYTTGALSDGRSAAYRKGPWGLKETFTHSPFDELSSVAMREPDARLGERSVLVEYEGERYRLEVRQS